MKNKLGKLIVFAIILISSWQVFTSVVHAQTPTPPTRESLTQEIEQRAQKDVELGVVPLSPSDLAVLFSEQAATVGMTMSEVKNIYDEAYQVATPAKSPWDDLLKPQGGWIFLIVGGLLVILANIAKDYLTTFGKKVTEHAYQRLARFRPFWMIALRRYRQSLEKTYSELKIPFRQGRPLQMQDVYVPVRVDGGSKPQVDAYQTIQGQKRLMVLGDPGSGKTMLLRHIAFTYARQGLYDFPGQPIPVFLELNRVESAGNSLLDALTKTLENHNFPGAGGFLQSALENHSLLILLDGLDEVNAQARPALVSQIQDLWQKYPDNRIIVTCRKAVYQGELDTWVDQKLEIIEFSDQQIQRFMTSWKKDMPAEKSIEHFFRTLQERPQIMALARNPLLLTMVAYLYTDTEFALPHSRSEFYSRSTDLLLDQWKLERNRYKATHKRIVLQRLALFNQSQAGKTGERRTLELAEALKEIGAVLPDLTLKTEDAQPLLDEIVQRSGLMLAIDGGTRYQFTHLTLQEYFAARALEADQNKLLDFYRATPDAWREVVRLWCALEHDSTAMLKSLYVLDPMITFECLSDAQQVDNAYADELIESLKPSLSEEVDNASLSSTFAMLAADPRPRGRKWFEFIKSNLDVKQNRLAACAVLSLTNIPQAAEPLAKLAATDSSVIPFLVQLGNLAVPALAQSVQKGEVWAMDALVDIGTPQAALALEPLLWTDELRAYQSAWRLAALLSLPSMEENLQTVVLTIEQRKSKQIEWIWEPFSDNLTLRTIIGRIAHLLHETPENQLPPKSLPCDHNLALPLCAIVSKIYLKKLNAANQKELQEQIIEKPLPMLVHEAYSFPLDEQKNIIEKFSPQLSENKIWQHIYSTLDIKKQISLLILLALGKISPEVDDWRNLNQPVRYTFSTSWHVKILKLLLSFLVILNLGGIWNQISQSATLLSWGNIGIILVGIGLLYGVTWAQRVTWSTSDLEVLIVILGLLFGISGEIVGVPHSWAIGAWGGALGVGILMTNKLSDFLFGSLLGTIVGALITFLFRGLIDVSNFIGISNLVCFSILVFFVIIGLMVNFNIATAILGVVLFSILNLLLFYFANKFVFDTGGMLIATIFWIMWLGIFSFLFLLGKRRERRAQNPLLDLLEPSGAVVSSRRAVGLWGRWFGRG